LVALSRARDQHHSRAVAQAHSHLAMGGRYLNTTLVHAELHFHLLYLRGAKDARVDLTNLLEDSAHE
jgi:predicted nucleic acid-binding protein